MTLLERLRDGDGAAFASLVDGYAASMLRVARLHVSSDAVAQEVVQETWLAVLQGLDRFEERSSLRTWIFHILVNRARTRGAREARTVPFATLAAREAEEPFAAVDADRFLPADDPSGPATGLRRCRGGTRSPSAISTRGRRRRPCAERWRRCLPCSGSS